MRALSIIIPAYNEVDGLKEVLNSLQLVMARGTFPYEIIVVDDGSTDGTDKIPKMFHNIKVIQHPENRGYGSAIKSGIQAADKNADWIAIIDADGSYPVEAILELIKYTESYDMVVGARVNQPITRKPAKWVLTKIANYLAGEKIPDLNSGLRIFKRNIVERFWELLPPRFSFTTFLTLAMFCNNYSIKYVPIKYNPRIGKSKIKPIRHTSDFLILLFRTIVYFNPLKVFMPISIGLILLGLVIGFYSKFVLGKLMDISTITSIVAGIETAVLGLLADLIVRRSK